MQTPLTSKFLAFLRRKNISYTRDQEGDYHFFYQGAIYYYLVYPNVDLPYFRLQQFCVDDATGSPNACQRACFAVSSALRVVKAYIDAHQNVTFSVEAFIPKGASNIEELFERFLSILFDAHVEYRKQKDKFLNENASDNHKDKPLASDPCEDDLADPEGIDLETFQRLTAQKHQ